MNLLEAWASYRPQSPPFVLPADRDFLSLPRSARAVATYCGWRAASHAPDFCIPEDTRVHLGLFPQPFVGNVRTASVYVLLLNPGLGAHDYFAEYEVPAFRKALLANLRQTRESRGVPFLFLDPQFAWHGGFAWWHGKLAKVIDDLARTWGVSFAEARLRLARKLAGIELFPYHSPAFRDSGGWLRNLKSVTLARKFVTDHVVPRVRSGKAVVIVTRRVADWDLPDLPGVIKYTSGQARSAHLTPESPGGRAIIGHLSRER